MIYWTYKGSPVKDKDFFPDKCVGFIYRITNSTKGKIYIGQKSLYNFKNKEVSFSVYKRHKEAGLPVTKTKNKKLSKKGSVVWRYKVCEEKESDWKTYVGSNKDLKKDFKRGDQIKKEILHLCYNKKQLSYYEVKQMMKEEVLESLDYYNDNILGKFFRKDLEIK